MASKAAQTNRAFHTLWIQAGHGDIEPVFEHRFHPERQWRFDVAFLDECVAVELDGGVGSRGGHVRWNGYHQDREKDNAAVLAGWHVLRFTTHHLKEQPWYVVDTVYELIQKVRNGS